MKTITRGWHSNRSCTLNCDLGQNFDRKILSWDFTIVGFIAEILLDLDQLDRISKRYSGLTVDYGEHFKLTVDLRSQIGVLNVLECHPLV